MEKRLMKMVIIDRRYIKTSIYLIRELNPRVTAKTRTRGINKAIGIRSANMNEIKLS